MARHKEFNVDTALERAMDAFWERGYEATSLCDLVQRMGIQRASLYDTFGDKRSLFLSALKHYHDKGLLSAREMFENAVDVIGALRRYLKHALPQSEQGERSKGCLFVNATVEFAPHDEEVATILREFAMAKTHIIAEAIARGQASGQIRLDISPIQAAEYMTTVVSGLSVSSKLVDDVPRLESLIELSLNHLRP